MSIFVEEVIKTHKVVVFSRTDCPYSQKAKNILAKYKINDIAIIEVNNRVDGDELLDYCAKITGARSTPRVFINGKFIGGGDYTEKLDSNGQLKELLQACDAI
ncbi:unnamed protein product [Brachionus calyciflorus]|uniref:Glutaredoxin domain-containing protein n=1 Tax=Brachionus calyciflorus TaxID=104777 RepID=A0A814QK24_9BILA|nr:unnamed protein product [Brachionus calyciflorus]